MTRKRKKRKPYELSMETNALPLDKFTWDKKTATLSADESDLREKAFDGRYRFLQPMFDDACDVGCSIRSHKTGRIVRFVWDQSKGINDDYTGGYEAWYFTAYDKDQPVKNVVIFND